MPTILDLIIRGLDCTTKRDTKDAYADVSPMYCKLIPQHYIDDGFLVTCEPYKEEMEHQVTLYEQLALDETFWSFLCTRRRNPTSLLHHKIETFVKNGIPPQYRSEVWLAMTGNQTEPSHFMSYKDLLELQPDADYVGQIKTDVYRSFTEIRDPSFVPKLTRVLTAYSIRNPKLGYCQSMNMLAGTMLIFMEEEHAFWMLVYLIEDLMPNYHSLTMSGFLADAEVFQSLVADTLPELHKHFQSLQCDIPALTAPWFLCLYIHAFPSVTAFVMWDIILYEGHVAILEVGLAVLRMLQEDLLHIDNSCDLVCYIRERCKKLYDPRKLLKYWENLDRLKVKEIKRNIQQRVEEDEEKIALIIAQFDEIVPCTYYSKQELMNLWHQFTIIFPSMCSCTSGIDLKQFSQLIGGTFSEWWVDAGIVERLYNLADVYRDRAIDFPELVALLSTLSRGTLDEVVKLNFDLFDINGRGWIDKFDLARMLRSMYGMFRNEKGFDKLLRNLVDDIFDFPLISDVSITQDTFQYVVLVQPQILEQLTTKFPHVKYTPRNTYFYWMDVDRPHRDRRVIHIALDQLAHIKQAKVPLPDIFRSSFNFSVF